jgi:dTMP kinase
MNIKRGIFITFEGIEGAGKSTQIKELRDFLQQSGQAVISTREPGGTPFADRIREILLTNRSEKVNERSEIFLYLASRAQHVSSVIKPALFQGITVLCDRFSDATIAYQGYGRGLDIDFLQKLNRYATEGIIPDLTILLNIPADLGIMRITRDKDRVLDRLESEDIPFHESVRRGYLQIASHEPERFLIIDGSREPGKVALEVQEEISKRFELGRRNGGVSPS